MPVRHIVTLLISVAVLLASATSPATAAEQRPAAPGVDSAGFIPLQEGASLQPSDGFDLSYPDAPTDSYRPRFVRQTGKNCAFASAAMLVDRWTGGRQRPSQTRLRIASRVPPTQGVSFAELSRAVAKVTGIELRFSPGGGDPLTWDALLSRLQRGGAAVIGGSYSRLPRHYQRWAPGFAALGAAGSGHAVYVERYEPSRNGGRVWMMDPLGRSAGYNGEWISVKALRDFAWRNWRGLITSAATPEPAPLAGYEFGTPELDESWPLVGRQVTIRLPLTVARGWKDPKDLAVQVDWQLLERAPDPADLEKVTEDAHLTIGDDEPDLEVGARSEAKAEIEDTDVAEVGAIGLGPKSARAKLQIEEGYLVAVVDVPSDAGLYELHLELRRQSGESFAKRELKNLASVPVRVHGSLAAELSLAGDQLEPAATRGSALWLDVTVANRGSSNWRKSDAAHLVAIWETPLETLPAAWTRVALDAGKDETVTIVLPVPERGDEGWLRVELFSGEGVPLEEFGAEPVILELLLVDPPEVQLSL